MTSVATDRATRTTAWAFATLVLSGGAALLVHGPIPQDPAYHLFADARALVGVPNFWNVISNVPFLIAGAAGLTAVVRDRPSGVLPELRVAYGMLFCGSVCVGLGSAAYHWAPSNATLVFDRLPMAVTFMAFFTIVLGEHVSPAFARRVLWPLIALGVGSVAWWAHTDDLRAYALVQFTPVLLLPVLILRHRSRLESTAAVWVVIGTYVAAKLLEQFDAAVMAAIGFSGHPLKHVVASVGVFAMVGAMRRQRRTTDPGGATSK